MAERVEWLHTERIAQLTGSRDPEDWPLPNVTDHWTVEGIDLGANAEHPDDGRLYFYFGDVATTDNGEHRWDGWTFFLPNDHQGADGSQGQPDWRYCHRCHTLFWANVGSTAGSVCAKGGEHAAAGWNFFLPNDHQGADGSQGQPDWRYCHRCHSLFWAPNGSTSNSACPAGGEHAAAGWNFILPNDHQGGHAGIGQGDWRFCRKCHSLGWGPNGGAAGSVCPGGNPRNSDLVAWTDDTAVQRPTVVRHVAVGWNFIVPNDHQGATDTTGQPDWRHCDKCYGLFWAPNGSAAGSVCPAGGPHRHHPESWRFFLPNNMQGATDATGQPDWRFCSHCHGLFYAPGGSGTGTVCPVGGTHRADPQSWTFYLPNDVQGASPSSGQPEWRYCSDCHGLFWNGTAHKGLCPLSRPGGIRLHPVMKNDREFAPLTASPPVGVTKSLETPGGAFSYEGRMYVFVNVSPEQYSEQVRPGDPAYGTYLISSDQPDQPGPYRTEFLFSPRIGACPRGPGDGQRESHVPLGYTFALPHDAADGVPRESNWRHCIRCAALFHDTNGTGANGLCWAGQGPHRSDGLRNYALAHGIPEDAHHQAHWHRCHKCATLFWNGAPDNQSLCPLGATHEPTAPGTPGLVLPHSDSPQQPPPHDVGWRYCARCHALVRTAERHDRFGGIGPTLVRSADHPYLPQGTEHVVVMAAFGWAPNIAFRLACLPVRAGSQPRLQDMLYYTGKDSPEERWSADDRKAADLLPHYGYTHVASAWLEKPKRWLMMYSLANDDRRPDDGSQPYLDLSAVARIASVPWDWRRPETLTTVFNPHREGAYTRYMHLPGQDDMDQRLEPGGDDHQGWAYGVFPLTRFTEWDEATRVLGLYYLLSTSSPYQVHLMYSRLRLVEE
ncbi:hypothetical protein ACFVXW_16050 [Streptomyces sp. NPDC058251]|uniref:hypothetical protein n=1 Tax=Streptomyces sp. NPDC058251 TaxID=3346404 RepID=UPI0036EC9486